jgi:hypothetical protein
VTEGPELFLQLEDAGLENEGSDLDRIPDFTWRNRGNTGFGRWRRNNCGFHRFRRRRRFRFRFGLGFGFGRGLGRGCRSHSVYVSVWDCPGSRFGYRNWCGFGYRHRYAYRWDRARLRCLVPLEIGQCTIEQPDDNDEGAADDNEGRGCFPAPPLLFFRWLSTVIEDGLVESFLFRNRSVTE